MITIDTYYLIDYENVHGDGLTGCHDLVKTDHIIIFFTENAKNLDMSDISDHGGAKLEMIKAPAGKQSADMHIGSFLGYLLGKNDKNCKVVIVSKDKDFDNVIKFWKEKSGVSISRTEQIKKKAATKKPTSRTKGEIKTKLNQEVMQAMKNKGYDAVVVNKVAQISSKFYGNENLLLEVHNALSENYKDYTEVYNDVKPVLQKYVNASGSKDN